MKANKKEVDLQLAFDVGHSSIGWAVLQSMVRTHSTASPSSSIEILGCGAVVFRADDCLASARRGYRRQRRHIRSTRQRIARMKLLLAHLGVLKKEELDRPGCAWPWLLAARVLRGGDALISGRRRLMPNARTNAPSPGTLTPARPNSPPSAKPPSARSRTRRPSAPKSSGRSSDA
jgi:hypothetical protein